MRISIERLREEWQRARDDSGLPSTQCAVFLIDAAVPPDSTPAAYHRPGPPDEPHCQLWPPVVRLVPPEKLDQYRWRHRVTLFAEIPDVPPEILGPLLRHELEHAVLCGRYGKRFLELAGTLSDVTPITDYAQQPIERVANLAAARYAAGVLPSKAIEAIAAHPDYQQLVNAQAPELDGCVVTMTRDALLVRLEDGPILEAENDGGRTVFMNDADSALEFEPGVYDAAPDDESDDVVEVAPHRCE